MLVELLGAGEATKRQAASSLVRVESPTEASERAVRGLCSDVSYLEFCLYGMGTYARKLRSAGQTARSEALGKALIDRLVAAAPGVEQQVALRGIANSGDGAAFVAVAPLLTHEATAVRTAAVDGDRQDRRVRRQRSSQSRRGRRARRRRERRLGSRPTRVVRNEPIEMFAELMLHRRR